MLASAFLAAIFWCGLVTALVVFEIRTNGRYNLTESDPSWSVTLGLIGQLHVLVSSMLAEAIPALQVLAFHAHFLVFNWTAAREFRALSVYFVVVPLYHYVRFTLKRPPISEATPNTGQKPNKARAFYSPTSVLLAGVLVSVGLIWSAARLLNDRRMFLEHVQMLLWIMMILLCVHLATGAQRAWRSYGKNGLVAATTLTAFSRKTTSSWKYTANRTAVRWTSLFVGLTFLFNGLFLSLAERSAPYRLWVGNNPLYYISGGLLLLAVAFIANKRDVKSMT